MLIVMMPGVGTILEEELMDIPLGIRRTCPAAVPLLLCLPRYIDGSCLSSLIEQQQQKRLDFIEDLELHSLY